MKKIFLLSLSAASGLLLPGCETTGDPNKGGIFWSESKAKQRIYAREQRLNDIEDDTAAANRRNRQLEQQLDQ